LLAACDKEIWLSLDRRRTFTKCITPQLGRTETFVLDCSKHGYQLSDPGHPLGM
jgi:hypothetical protein